MFNFGEIEINNLDYLWQGKTKTCLLFMLSKRWKIILFFPEKAYCYSDDNCLQNSGLARYFIKMIASTSFYRCQTYTVNNFSSLDNLQPKLYQPNTSTLRDSEWRTKFSLFVVSSMKSELFVSFGELTTKLAMKLKTHFQFSRTTFFILILRK